MIRIGGDGVISVLGNAYPAQFTEMIHKSLDEETVEEASLLHQKFSALYSLLFKDGNPAGIKCLLHLLFPRYQEVLRLHRHYPPRPGKRETLKYNTFSILSKKYRQTVHHDYIQGVPSVVV